MASSYKLSSILGGPVVHAFALLCAAFLVFAVKIQKYNLQETIGVVDNLYFDDFTPYYPGLADLKKHELFNPIFRNRKKIIILGASTADSIGCDGSWTRPDQSRQPPINAHYTCSISWQLNELLKEQGFSEWRSFNLARNGTSLTPMLYTYSRAMEVKPEVIVWGETFPFYMADNASSNTLPPNMYGHLDAVFDRPSTKGLWQSYRQTIAHGERSGGDWTLPPYAPALLPSDNQMEPRARTSLLNLVSLEFTKVRDRLKWDMPPRPVLLYPEQRSFQMLSPDTSPFVNPDPKLAYFQGFGLVGALQKERGDHMVMYFLPQYDARNKINYIRMFNDGPFTNFLDQYGIDHKNLIDLPLKPVEETYDGVHQTRAGNRIIAAAILEDLIDRHIVTRK